MTGQTRHLIAAQLLPHFLVRRGLLKRSRAGVAVQAFTIIVGLIKNYFLRYGPEIINVEMLQSSHLRLQAAKHRVIGVTGITGFISRDAIVLKMGSGNIGRIVDAQTFPVGFHRMAG